MAAKTRNIKKLDDLMDGALTERFNRGFDEVLRNVFDHNTDPEKKRKIVLTVTIQPNKDRTSASFMTDIKTVTAPPVTLSQMVLIARDDEGNVVAQEITNQVSGQIGIDGSVTIPKVLKFTNPNDQNAKEV
jgi:hypothetical protein